MLTIDIYKHTLPNPVQGNDATMPAYVLGCLGTLSDNADHQRIEIVDVKLYAGYGGQLWGYLFTRNRRWVIESWIAPTQTTLTDLPKLGLTHLGTAIYPDDLYLTHLILGELDRSYFEPWFTR